jgi:hypothetical protein
VVEKASEDGEVAHWCGGSECTINMASKL